MVATNSSASDKYSSVQRTLDSPAAFTVATAMEQPVSVALSSKVKIDETKPLDLSYTINSHSWCDITHKNSTIDSSLHAEDTNSKRE